MNCCSEHWGWFGAFGTGVDSALWVPLATTVVPWTIVALAPPRGHIRIFSAALVTWQAAVFAMFSYASLTLGSRMTLRGDTFGVELNVALIAPLLSGLALAASVWWVVKNRQLSRSTRPIPWRPRVGWWIGVAVVNSLAILTLFALRDGAPPHATSDRIAILLVVLQFFIAPRIFDPPAPDRT